MEQLRLGEKDQMHDPMWERVKEKHTEGKHSQQISGRLMPSKRMDGYLFFEE